MGQSRYLQKWSRYGCLADHAVCRAASQRPLKRRTGSLRGRLGKHCRLELRSTENKGTYLSIGWGCSTV